MRIMSVFTSFGGLEKTGGFAQTIMMSTNPKVDDPCMRCPGKYISKYSGCSKGTIVNALANQVVSVVGAQREPKKPLLTEMFRQTGL